ncbi:MAG: DUF59 domain-containing protein [Euryarchaeota archaeon]|nr:DUF59 domain-containing protein [Euryarchaeota archaeon]
MTSRAQKAAQRQLLDVLSSWQEPHGSGTLAKSSVLKAMQVNDDGSVKIRVTPARAHCPCCLLDLIDLRAKLIEKRKITAVFIEVVDIPDVHRWTSSINE